MTTGILATACKAASPFSRVESSPTTQHAPDAAPRILSGTLNVGAGDACVRLLTQSDGRRT